MAAAGEAAGAGAAAVLTNGPRVPASSRKLQAGLQRQRGCSAALGLCQSGRAAAALRQPGGRCVVTACTGRRRAGVLGQLHGRSERCGGALPRFQQVCKKGASSIAGYAH